MPELGFGIVDVFFCCPLLNTYWFIVVTNHLLYCYLGFSILRINESTYYRYLVVLWYCLKSSSVLTSFFLCICCASICYNLRASVYSFCSFLPIYTHRCLFSFVYRHPEYNNVSSCFLYVVFVGILNTLYV